MAHIFWDTSALVRRYAIREHGAERVRAATAPASGHQHLVSRLLTAEVASVLALKVRIGELEAVRRDAAWQLFQRHLERDYEVVELSYPVWRLAEDLLFRRSLRAGDAIHLAAALTVRLRPAGRDIVFWTADKRQAEAGSAEGLAVELLA